MEMMAVGRVRHFLHVNTFKEFLSTGCEIRLSPRSVSLRRACTSGERRAVPARRRRVTQRCAPEPVAAKTVRGKTSPRAGENNGRGQPFHLVRKLAPPVRRGFGAALA